MSHNAMTKTIARYHEIEWDVIANMRHHLVHGYYHVNAKDVWDVLQHDLSPVRQQVAHLLETIDWKEWK